MKTIPMERMEIGAEIEDIHEQLDEIEASLEIARDEGNDDWIMDLETDREILEGQLSELNERMTEMLK